MKVKFTLALLLGALVIFTSSARATAITRSGSGYGPFSSSGYATCAADAIADALGTGTDSDCIGVQLASYQIEIGGTEYSVYQFAFDGDGAPNNEGVIDLVDLGAVAASTSIDLPVISTDPTLSGVFTCSNTASATKVTDSSFPANTVTIPGSSTPLGCTPGSQAGSINGGPDFTTTAAISDLVLFTEDGNLDTGASTPAPEPSSLTLVGMGLVALALLSRRRVQA